MKDINVKYDIKTAECRKKRVTGKKGVFMVKKNKVVDMASPLIKLLLDPNRFQKLEDGWIRDTLVGVEWGPTAKEAMTHKDAVAYCAKLGARLPEVNELQSLVDYTRKEPAIDTDMFPDAKSSYYWTRTQYQYWKGSAWCVSFGYGSVGLNDKDDSFYVRPVRASQA